MTHDLRRTLLLFAVIIIEGYVVLATELLAIRQTVPYVGSGTDTVSIVIAAVLMPLAFGYYKGGSFRPERRDGKLMGVRARLIRNILVSLAILVPGLSYLTMNFFFYQLIGAGLTHRLILITIYCALFIVTPVYLLGQTIPLISNYFTKERLARITGRILFFSTMGSFAGAVFSTLVLMAFLGVQNTAVFNFILLALLVLLLAKRKASETAAIAIALAVAGIGLNAPPVMKSLNVVGNNQYNLVTVFDDPKGFRHMSLNHMASSKYRASDDRKHLYIEFLEDQLIEKIPADAPPKDVLVIGAGAFTFGLDDEINRYDYIDIDPQLKDLAENLVLERKLLPNKTFTPVEARAFLRATDKKWDIIVIDVFLGGVTIPEHLVTREFFQQLREHLNEGGVVAANFMMSANFSNALSRNMDATFRSVFPFVTRTVIHGDHKVWTDSDLNDVNAIYIYRQRPGDDRVSIYTDDKNAMFFDKPQKY